VFTTKYSTGSEHGTMVVLGLVKASLRRHSSGDVPQKSEAGVSLVHQVVLRESAPPT